MYLSLLTCFSAILFFFSTFSHHILLFSTSTDPQGPLLLLFLLPFILMMFLFIFPPVILFLECFYIKSEDERDHKRYLPTLLSPGKSVLKRSEDIVQSPVSGCISASHSFSRQELIPNVSLTPYSILNSFSSLPFESHLSRKAPLWGQNCWNV